MYYIDINKNKYSSINNYKHHISNGKIRNKELLYSNAELVIIKKNKIIYKNNNIQSLYLYPLNILDYIQGINKCNTIMFHLIDICDIDYEKYFSKIDFKYFKNIEIMMNDCDEDKIEKIIQISKFLKSKGSYISYNIKKLNYNRDTLKKIGNLGDYYKIFLNDISDKEEFLQFVNNLKILRESTNNNSVIHIKSYLDINQVKYYKYALYQFQNIVDIYQVSKELMPLNIHKNISIKQYIQDSIRVLEKEYLFNPKFIGVKDISTLYYPRFILDERNYRKCFACYMKPYIYGNLVLPCKVNEVIENKEKWKISDISLNYDMDIITKCGKKCGDCASIFENDILNEINNIINDECVCLLKVGD